MDQSSWDLTKVGEIHDHIPQIVKEIIACIENGLPEFGEVRLIFPIHMGKLLFHKRYIQVVDEKRPNK